MIVFWALAFISENISIICLQNTEIEISVFSLRYVTVLSIFILGFNAPGIVQENDDQDRLLDVDNESNVTATFDTHDITEDMQSESPEICDIRTTIIVPRRLSTLIKTEEIIVLCEGVIVERGRHDDLLILNGNGNTFGGFLSILSKLLFVYQAPTQICGQINYKVFIQIKK